MTLSELPGSSSLAPQRGLAALLARPVVRFLLAGGANTAVTYLLFRTFLRLLSGQPSAAGLAQALAYAIGVAVSYVVNRTWTFQSAGTLGRTLPRFLAAHLGSLTLSTTLIQVSVALLRFPVTLSWVAVTGLTTVVNFTVQRFWVFPATSRELADMAPQPGGL